MTIRNTAAVFADLNLADLGIDLAAPAPPPTVSREQVCLVGAKDAHLATYSDLGAVEVPEATVHRNSGNVQYMPVRYTDFADLARSVFADALDAEPVHESYALARGGNQMFGRIVFPWRGREDRGFQVALRSSYDMSISNQVAGGLSTFICANGMLSGEAMIKAKHTLNVGPALVGMLREMAGRVDATGAAMNARLDGWSNTPMGDDLFYAFCGILVGRGMVTPTIANAAMRYWRACRSGELHNEHSDPTLANAYQAVSGGLLTAHPARAFRQFASVDHVADAVARSGGAMTGIPEFALDIEEYSAAA